MCFPSSGDAWGYINSQCWSHTYINDENGNWPSPHFGKAHSYKTADGNTKLNYKAIIPFKPAAYLAFQLKLNAQVAPSHIQVTVFK